MNEKPPSQETQDNIIKWAVVASVAAYAIAVCAATEVVETTARFIKANIN